MSQTLEAIVSETGEISLLMEICLEKPYRALVTILDEEPKISDESRKEKLFAVLEKCRKQICFETLKILWNGRKS